MTLHDVDVYKCIHASECSFLVAIVYETANFSSVIIMMADLVLGVCYAHCAEVSGLEMYHGYNIISMVNVYVKC